MYNNNNDILMKNKLDIMIESANIEESSILSSNVGDVDLEFALEAVMTISSDMEYPIHSIPILVQESEYGGQIYLVEYDMLAKILESYDDFENEREAMEALAEANEIDYNDLYLVIESQEYFEDIVNEAKAKGGSNLKAKKVNNVVKSIEDLKKQGIKIAKKGKPKKKSKKKSKSKKKGLLGMEFETEKVTAKTIKGKNVKMDAKKRKIKL